MQQCYGLSLPRPNGKGRRSGRYAHGEADGRVVHRESHPPTVRRRQWAVPPCGAGTQGRQQSCVQRLAIHGVRGNFASVALISLLSKRHAKRRGAIAVSRVAAVIPAHGKLADIRGDGGEGDPHTPTDVEAGGAVSRSRERCDHDRPQPSPTMLRPRQCTVQRTLGFLRRLRSPRIASYLMSSRKTTTIAPSFQQRPGRGSWSSG